MGLVGLVVYIRCMGVILLFDIPVLGGTCFLPALSCVLFCFNTCSFIVLAEPEDEDKSPQIPNYWESRKHEFGVSCLLKKKDRFSAKRCT